MLRQALWPNSIFASDRSYMLIGEKQGDNRAPAEIILSAANFGPYPMSHGLTRLESRFQADPSEVDTAKSKIGEALDAETVEALGLITFALRRHRLGRRSAGLL